MATTYELIASTTVGSGGASSITFSSISSSYTDLLIKVSARSTQANPWGSYEVQLNSTTSGTSKILYGTGSGTGSDNNTSTVWGGYQNGANATSSVFSNGDIYIPNYNSSNKKSISGDAVTENNDTAALSVFAAGLNDLTSAVTSITLNSPGGNFVQYSTAYLYGIKNS